MIRSRPHQIRIKTVTGEVCVDSLYGQDPVTKKWLCPVRHLWNLGARQQMSPVLEEKLCFTATMTGSYESAAQVAGKWGTPADDTTIHSHVNQAGERALALEEDRVERALNPATRAQVVAEAAASVGSQPFSLVIEMDGWMVRERGTQWGLKPVEKQADRVAWREMKTAVIFRTGHRARTQSGRAVILEKAYVTWRGDPQEFGRRLHAEALRRGLHQAQQVFVVADGAPWIWNIAADRFDQATGVLDFYHASEHLWAVARTLYDDEKKARKWVEPLLHQLNHGGTDRVIRRLEYHGKRLDQYDESVAQVIGTELGYFQNHRARMDYEKVSAQGCPKGSGAIESTCSQLQDRFKRTGQFWTLPGERALLALDMARRNNDWNRIWETAA